MRLVLFAACFLMAGATHAQPYASNVLLSSPIIADAWPKTIEIRADFNGTQMLIFGASNVPGDLVIAVRGPAMDATLRRKERIAGMWMHVDQLFYPNLPSFYAVASTKPLNRIAPPKVLQTLGLGARRIIEASNPVPNEMFDAAIGKIMLNKTWWQQPFGAITYFSESLFSARLEIPDTLPNGHYTADIYLFSRGKLIGLQTIPMMAHKIGFDARVADMAKHQSALYGFIAISLALFGGWLGHRLFGSRR